MSYDTYIIDENAAHADMAKMRRAMETLSQARQSVTQLRSCAEGMQGQTGQAIAQKAQELQHRIDALTRQLQSSIALVNRAVISYQQRDEAAAARIRRGG